MKTISFIVFLLPLVSTFMFGTLVMGEILKLPDRELNLLQFNEQQIQNDVMTITGIKNTYEKSSPININVIIDDSSFSCGDLFLSIRKIDSDKTELITQSGFFGQCFQQNDQLLTINDEFVEIIDIPGEYEIIAQLHDKHYKKIAIVSKKFLVI